MKQENYDVFFGKVDDNELACVDIETDEGVIECAVIAVFDAPPFGYEYMALVDMDQLSRMEDPDNNDEPDNVILMRYIEEEGSNYRLEPLNEVELHIVSEAFQDFLDSEPDEE